MSECIRYTHGIKKTWFWNLKEAGFCFGWRYLKDAGLLAKNQKLGRCKNISFPQFALSPIYFNNANLTKRFPHANKLQILESRLSGPLTTEVVSIEVTSTCFNAEAPNLWGTRDWFGGERHVASCSACIQRQMGLHGLRRWGFTCLRSSVSSIPRPSGGPRTEGWGPLL